MIEEVHSDDKEDQYDFEEVQATGYQITHPAPQMQDDDLMDDYNEFPFLTSEEQKQLFGHGAADSSTNAGSHQFPNSFVVKYPDPLAGGPVPNQSAPTNTFRAYQATLGNPEENIYHPYRSKLDWDLANWANRRNPGSNALLELLAISGVVKKLDISYSSSRKMNKIVDESLPDPATFLREEVSVKGAKSDVYSPPEKHYKDETTSERVYHDTNTATFWWNAQVKLDARGKQGATIAPLIFASDKTQITLFRNKAVYPVYMTTANIPKEIRRGPSSGAWVLNLPFANIHVSITPDFLHQRYQWVFEHIKNWIIEAYGAAETDARCACLPPNRNIRLFLKGVTSLQQITGQEHDQISRSLLGILADLPLPGGESP
ncbi:hypothetical protein BDV98DRAFT_594929 [Pterulicium gracile]|uniref:Uncharacterized protein n=1 Tax=Pterulicium gracile TaxID=1884261 RepID=A0A5C3QBX2_9AGAR|nr:hypothetical protein BDV98DRAFT_594929 [Pterula gracilis]